MEPVSQKLYELESEQARQQEDEVRPGPPPEMAARKTAALFGIELSDQQLQRGTLAFHNDGLAISWAPLYQVLRRKTGLGPRRARHGRGDEPEGRRDHGAEPRLHRSQPGLPALVTHLQGVAAHLVFGLAVAGVTEAAWLLVGQ